MPPIRSALALAAAAAALAVPSLASAQPAFYEVEYRIDFDATARWSIDRTDVSAGGTSKDTHTVDSETRLSGTLENITFRNGQLLNTGEPFAVADQTTSGGGQSKHEQWNPTDQRWEVTTGPCTAIPEPSPPGMVRLGRDTSSGPVNGAALVARFADEPVVQFSCPQTSNTGAPLANHATFPDGTFDARFTLPAETIGMGLIIQHVSGRQDQQSPAWCPGERNDGGATTRSCTFTWSGKLTFTKVSEYQYEGDLPTPETPPAPVADPRAEALSWAMEQYGKEAPPKDPRAEALSWAVDQYGKEAPPKDPRAEALSWAVDQYGKELQFEASCPTGCTGTAEILRGAPRGKADRRAYMATSRALAKLRFKVAPGARQTVRLRLPRKARIALRRARRAHVRIKLVPAKGGKPVVRSLALPRRR